MKSIIRFGKWWRKNASGFTLAELMIAMAAGSFVMGGVFAVWAQLFSVTTVNSNYMAAFRQVQNSGDWISRDALMTQGVYEMAATALDGGITDGDDTIQVTSTDGFPSSGIIGIEDELIQYTGKTATEFTGCTRGYNAAAHDSGQSVTVFLALNWTEWSGDQYQVVYNLKESSRQLMRSQFTNGSLVNTTLIAEAIDPDPTRTSSDWDYDARELKVVITASVGDYVLGKHGVQSEMATRTYRVHPRPLF